MENKKYLYSVLTVNTNNYEQIHEVQNPNPNVEYVCVTDNPELTSNTWKIIYKPNIWFLYVKHHQYEFVTTDVCLWLDGSYQITNDPTENFVLPFINSNKEFAISLHDVRHNVIEESLYWVFKRYMPIENMLIFVQNVINNNFNADILFQTSVMLTKKTTDVLHIFEEVEKVENACSINGPYRDDQTILSFVIGMLYYKWDKLLLMDFGYTYHNNYWYWCKHGSTIPIFINTPVSYRCFDEDQKLLYCIR